MGSKILENISLVRSIISEDSFTLYKDEGRHHPDHQEEVDGHDGIGNGSGVDYVQLDDSCLDLCYGEINIQESGAWQWSSRYSQDRLCLG